MWYSNRRPPLQTYGGTIVWDSFTLNTPNWQSCLPGAECPGDAPDGFLSRDEIIAYFEGYVERFHLPVRYGMDVEAVEPNGVIM